MLLRIMENILCYNPLRVIPKVESFEYMFLYTDIQLFILFPSAKDFANFDLIPDSPLFFLVVVLCFGFATGLSQIYISSSSLTK